MFQRETNEIIKMAYRDDKFYWTKEDLAPFQLEEELQVWRDLELVALKRKWYSEDHVNLKTDVNFYSDASNHGCGGGTVHRHVDEGSPW